ncbi:MAG: DUF11 domain-containing protein, partial [Bacteroidetes bacterium]|nr:DUF11 domain-containing protein [Bacteroidota bacterium]
MKNSLLIALVIVVTLGTSQEAKIDFRTTDIKYLNQQQLKEFVRWRAEQFRLMKSSGVQSEVKSLFIQGNKISSIIYNTGAISNPSVQGNVLDLVWNGLGYGYEFGPLVTSRVPKATDQEIVNSDHVALFDTLKLTMVSNISSASKKPGEILILKIVIKNTDGIPLSNIVVRDTLRKPLTLISSSTSAFGTGSVTVTDSIVAYTNTSLAAKASDTITILARIDTLTALNSQIFNRAYANYNNSRFIYSSVTLATNANATLGAYTNVFIPSTTIGDTIKIVVTIANLSSITPLLNVSLTDTVHFPMKLIGKSVNSGTVTTTDSVVTYTNPQILPGSTSTLTILAKVASGNLAKQRFINRIYAIGEKFSADSVDIVIDGFGGSSKNTADGDFNPDGVTKWGWLPKAGYSAPNQNDIASWGARTSDLRLRPKSWPESWYNPVVGEYIYPSFLGGNSSVPDEEVYYIVDDSTDAEFEYYPFPANQDRRGLGINLEVRSFQFANPLAEDIIFLVYTAENDVKAKSLPKVFFGMFGDPHIGGAKSFSDDAASFIPARPIGKVSFDELLEVDNKTTSQLSRNIVYSWDPKGNTDIPGIPPGYFGYKFLESPNNSVDGIDNDDDGIIDEDPGNDKGTYIDGVNVSLKTGVKDTAKYIVLYGALKARWSGDEDGDWNKETDDIGVDGIFGTGDFGEGNGVPDQLFGGDGEWLGSEPNFGIRDVNESDQIGLRSFWSLPFGGNNRPKNDNLMYAKISSEFDTAALGYLYTTSTDNIGDYIFLYGSGPFSMHPGHRERFSIALLMGSDLKDLLLNSETAQLVLAANYRFAQPPPKPKVRAVPGNGRVTLYWDNSAESASDPFSGKKDF